MENIYSKSVYPQPSPIEAVAQKRLDNSALIHIQEILRGKTFVQSTDNEGNITYSGFMKTSDPVMNERGIGAVMFFLSTFINPIVWLSNISNKQIDNICYNLDIELEKNLINKEEAYEMTMPWNTIKVIVMEFIEISLRKAVEGFTSDELKSVKSIEMQRLDDNRKDGIGRLIGLGGNK